MSGNEDNLEGGDGTVPALEGQAARRDELDEAELDYEADDADAGGAIVDNASATAAKDAVLPPEDGKADGDGGEAATAPANGVKKAEEGEDKVRFIEKITCILHRLYF